jgi:phospholipid-binding lipoprotein MlaA
VSKSASCVLSAALAVAIVVTAPMCVSAADAEQAVANDSVPADDSLVDPLLAELESEETAEAAFPDPFESFNRGALRFNRGVDRFFLNPIATAYRFVLPPPARRAVMRVLDNLHSPQTLVNDVLQREWKDAGLTVARFTVNSTIGIGGIFDPATPMGIAGHDSDFGQTLALYGMSSGPFLILPLVGPTTARDGTGYVVDFFFRPTTWILPFFELALYTTIHESSLGLALRDAHGQGLELLEESSIDFYAALRSAYTQRRLAQIWARREHHRPVEVARVDAPTTADAPNAAAAELADSSDSTRSLLDGTGR